MMAIRMTTLLVLLLLSLQQGTGGRSARWFLNQQTASSLDGLPKKRRGCCVSPNISFDEKLNLNADVNDHDRNGIITAADIAYDLNNDYDTNGDKIVTEKEWISHWTCAFGDTPYFARFTFNMISRGNAHLTGFDFYRRPMYVTGVPRATFIKRNRERFTLFYTYNCVNTDLKVDQKLDRIMKDNDHNNDGVFDYSDIKYDLKNNYDKNNDGKVTKAEWVLRWCCAYGDTSDYARYVWNTFFQGHDFIKASQFDAPPISTTGIPIDEFMAFNRETYKNYAAAQAQPPVEK